MDADLKVQVFAETERYIVREMLPDDLEGMFALDSDPEVHRYLGNKIVTDRNKSAEIIRSVRQQYKDHGIGRWAVIDKQTNDFIGWTGLKFVTEWTNEHIHYYDLGYRLIKKYWGQGIATETSRIALHYAFEILKVEEVFAAASCEHPASNKVLQRIGMQCMQTFYYEDILCNWYRFDRSAYQGKLRNPA